MNTIDRFYYDFNGNKIDCNTLNLDPSSTHDEIASAIIKQNPDLLNEYKKIRETGVISESVFLVMKGFIYVGGSSQRNMSNMYSSISLNENTRNLVGCFKEDGYFTYDIIRNELRDDQKEQIRTWAKQGISRNEIINKVMKDMIVLLSPTKNTNKEDEEFER